MTEELPEDLEELVREEVERRVKEEKEELRKELKQELKDEGRGASEKQSSSGLEQVSRRGFLKALGSGAIGLGALSLIPPASALQVRSDGLSFFGGEGSSLDFDIDNSGNVDVKGALSMNDNAINNVDWANSDTGSGSGLNADKVDGAHSSEFMQTDTKFRKVDKTPPAGSEITSLVAPSNHPWGIDVDSGGSIWLAGNVGDSVWKLDDTGSQITSFSIVTSPTGLGLDANDSIWLAENGGQNSTFKLDDTGSKITSIQTPNSGNAFDGVGIDSNGSLWFSDNDNACLFKTDTTGSEITSISTANDDPLGAGVDSNDSLWVVDISDSSAFQHDDTGSVMKSFSVTANRGAGFDSSDSLWVTDNSADSLFKLTAIEEVVFKNT